jgi:Fe-S cluster assembly iron-binding protein IscA
MALDEPKKGDELFEDDGITFVVDKQLFDRVKPIRIDFLASKRGPGFSVSGNLPAGGRC